MHSEFRNAAIRYILKPAEKKTSCEIFGVLAIFSWWTIEATIFPQSTRISSANYQSWSLAVVAKQSHLWKNVLANNLAGELQQLNAEINHNSFEISSWTNNFRAQASRARTTGLRPNISNSEKRSSCLFCPSLKEYLLRQTCSNACDNAKSFQAGVQSWCQAADNSAAWCLIRAWVRLIKFLPSEKDAGVFSCSHEANASIG